LDWDRLLDIRTGQKYRIIINLHLSRNKMSFYWFSFTIDIIYFIGLAFHQWKIIKNYTSHAIFNDQSRKFYERINLSFPSLSWEKWTSVFKKLFKNAIDNRQGNGNRLWTSNFTRIIDYLNYEIKIMITSHEAKLTFFQVPLLLEISH
jgi:hypothetical protein